MSSTIIDRSARSSPGGITGAEGRASTATNGPGIDSPASSGAGRLQQLRELGHSKLDMFVSMAHLEVVHRAWQHFTEAIKNIGRPAQG